MAVHTPSRRISPRTKRRYRAIRDFFRRALGSSSQQDIKINSNIAVNVTDLKHKIGGIECKLNEVNRNCRDLACLERNLRRDTAHLLPDRRNEIFSNNEHTSTESSSKSKSSNTEVLYKNSREPFKRSDESEYACNCECDQNLNMETESAKIRNNKKHSRINVRECHRNLRKHSAQSNVDNFTEYSTSSFHSRSQALVNPRLNTDYSRHRFNKKHGRSQEYLEFPVLEETKVRRSKEQVKRTKSPEIPGRYDENDSRSRKNKHKSPKLDDDFIAEIIKRQYKPVKLFSARRSDTSQFSAPVCRDQEFSLHENLLEGEDLCSCYCDHSCARYVRNHGLGDMRSICDTRLYSSARHKRHRRPKRHVDIYNDSRVYDVIPVKERISPKSRRKFVEDNMIPNEYYKEVPPSPRTHRPRLNLKAQYYSEYDGHFVVHPRHPSRRHSQGRAKRQQEFFDTLESDVSEMIRNRIPGEKEKYKSQKANSPVQVQRKSEMMSSPQYSPHANDINTTQVNDITLNKTQDTDLSVEKTNRALCEIKDILQNFLQEIKNATPSQCDKSDISTKPTVNQLNGLSGSGKIATIPTIPNSNSFNQCSGTQCLNPPYIPSFANPCCYPIMPVCPVNCMQNGYILPSPSFSYHAFANNQKDTVCLDCSKAKKDIANDTYETNPRSNETEELIKEIYKFVAQSPSTGRKNNNKHEETRRKEAGSDRKQMTTRSVGGSSRPSRHDAKVGTPKMKCYSKSCEAIGSRIITDPYYTNTTHSDTILDKLSLEVTQSDTELSSDSTVVEKTKKSKFTKVLQSFGIFKKKKIDGTEELSESESSMEVDKRRKSKSPYRKDMINYMMHGQEYYHRPPVGPYHRPEGPYGYAPGYDPRGPYPVTELYTPHRIHQDTIHEHAASHYRTDRPHPTAPPYPHHFDNHYHHANPQVPLCLKEIEVKSTGTQSERKISFFKKLAKGPPQRSSDPIKNNYTQTKLKEEPKQGLFAGLKRLQEKAKEIENEPMKFSFKTQKKLAEGDIKMRNVMLKKMFHKRNPFSPGNLITRTLLGKDKSSYGEPANTFRPRMFF